MAVAKKISIENAKPDKLFYFVANVVVYRRSDERVLILKRIETEKVFPGLWAMIGGKLEHGDFDITKPDNILNEETISFWNPIEKLLQREIKEEAGIEVHDRMTYLRSVMFVRPDGIPTIMPVFVAEYKSGEVEFEKDSFTDSAWVNEKEMCDYKCIPSIYDEAEAALKLCRSTPAP